MALDVTAQTATQFNHYTANVQNATDYYAFGSPMNGRNFIGANSYRYGMNGQEKDGEVFDGATTAEFWEYDSRIGRRWNMDPVPIVGISDYAAFNNNPIKNTDVNGDIVEFADVKTFFRVFFKSLFNKDFRKQLIEQSRKTRTSEQETIGANGKITNTEIENPVYFRYKYNPQSENSLEQAANKGNDMAFSDEGKKSSANARYELSFSDKSEDIRYTGHSGSLKTITDYKYWKPIEISSKESYKDGTITINLGYGNEKNKNTILRIYQGSKLIDGGRRIVVPTTPEFSTEGAIRNRVIPFSGERHSKIRIVISSEDTPTGNPGAFGVDLTIRKK